MRLIIALVLTAWAAICTGAWWLADARIALCGPDYDHDQAKMNCIVRATAVRDDVLLWGPAVALLALLVLAVIFLRPTPGSLSAGRIVDMRANPKPMLPD